MKHFALAHGRRLAFRESGSGMPLVLLHGWSLSSAVFSEVIPELKARFRVLAPDLPGHGFSDPPAGEFRFGGIAADLAEWLNDLGIEGGALLGWSMGGQVALELCRLESLRIEKLILVATTPRFVRDGEWSAGLPSGQVRALGRNLGRNLRETLEQFFNLQFEGESLPPNRLEQLARLAAANRLDADPGSLRDALTALEKEDQRPLLEKTTMPSLVVHGELDRIVPPTVGSCLAARLACSRLEILQGVGHAPFLSRPQETIALWQDFLS